MVQHTYIGLIGFPYTKEFSFFLGPETAALYVDCTTELLTEFLVFSAEKAANNRIAITFNKEGK